MYHKSYVFAIHTGLLFIKKGADYVRPCNYYYVLQILCRSISEVFPRSSHSGLFHGSNEAGSPCNTYCNTGSENPLQND